MVVDTSIALKWILVEPDSQVAEDLLSQWAAYGMMVMAPSLMVYEVANALYQNVRQGVITVPQTQPALDGLYRAGIVLDCGGDANLGFRAIELAHQTGLGPAYDTQFLALAEREDCEYWTADRRFWTTMRPRFPRVRWLGELAATAQTPHP